MPLIQPAVLAVFQANLAANGIAGVSAPLMAAAISGGFVQYMQTGVIATSVDVGVLGAGTGIAPTVTLAAPAIVGPMQGTFTAAQINGPMRDPLINAIAASVSAALATAQVSTVNAGVGVGTGLVSLVPNSGVSVPLMVANFSAAALLGPSAAGLATAIAQGIDAALPSATATVVIAGGPGPLPGSGVGVGKVL
jgi:hypothetical protein